MTNPTLSNKISSDSAILWQYDKAPNLIHLIQNWNEFATVSCERFWNYIGNKVFPIDAADEYGLTVWGKILGIARPKARNVYKWSNMTTANNRASGRSTIHFIPVAIGMQSTADKITSITIKSTDGNGLYTSPVRLKICDASETTTFGISSNVVEMKNQNTEYTFNFTEHSPLERETSYTLIFVTEESLPQRAQVALRIKYSSGEQSPGLYFGGNLDFVPVITVEWLPSAFESPIAPISDAFYRRILKARFFMMNHSPTVPNYNKFLAILFGAIDSTSNQIEYDTTKIFDAEGNVNSGYTARSQALDFQDMTMGFSFPIDATDEEALTIFQHYDTLYPFPAGIRYPGEFIDDELVIGLNTDATGETGDNQNYKNFVDGLVLAESDEGNPNGGIFSTTDRANYLTKANYASVFYVLPVTKNDSSDSSSDDSDVGSASITVFNTTASPQKVWVDWGNGECGYHYLNANAQGVSLSPTRGYDFDGLVAIQVYFPEDSVTVTDPTGAVKKYGIFSAS